VKWATFDLGEGDTRTGLVVGDDVHALEPGVSLVDLLGDDGERLAAAGERAGRDPAAVAQLESVRLRPPLRPPVVRDHYAFEDHVRWGRESRGLEMDPAWYDLPVFYFSNPYSVIGPGDPVLRPPETAQLDFELEVAAVVGMAGRDLSTGDAERHIAGFTIMNDWSARDVQRREMALNLGPHKGKDFATSIGPFLVTPDELAECRKAKGYDLSMTALVNGRLYSQANWSDIAYSFAEFLAYDSRGTKVGVGDLIGSGTCGTGCILELSARFGEEKYPWLQPGDVVDLKVERIGTLRNRVV
jgi:2-keto-4-pentenoate hydratase/2-oxohepta-3-ene-1,7-dioic acid hydratase in catechol pathway